jgi:hypothetical protein
MANSPVLWGPNSTATVLQNQELLANGTLLSYNGPKNYISYGNFETGNTTGWSIGNVGTLTNGLPTGTPTFGSGANANLSFTAYSTSSALAGSSSAQISTTSASSPGDMVATQVYKTDLSDSAKCLQYKISYRVDSGLSNINLSGTSANSVGVAVWDSDYGVWLPVSGAFNFVQGSGTGIATGTFQTTYSTNSGHIQLCVYFPNASAGAFTISVDDVFVGPQPTAIAPAMSDEQAYTPTFAGLVASSPAIFWSRRGDKLYVRADFTVGSVSASIFTMSLPNGLTASANMNAASQIGRAYRADGGAPATNDYVILGFPSSNTINASFVNVSGTNAGTGQAANSMFANGDFVHITLEVPIVGWSSNTASSADTDTRVISFTGNTSSQAFTSGSGSVAFSATSDSAGAWTGNSYKVPVSGNYYVEFNETINQTGHTFGIYLNGVQITFGTVQATAGAMTSGGILLPNVTSGSTISFTPFASANGTITTANVSIFRLSGPAVVQATESVNASYYVSANFAASTTVPINFDTKEFDSHGAVTPSGTAWKFTAPVTGTYQVSACPFTSGSANNIALYKNGLAYKFMFNTQGSQPGSGTVLVRLLAGDYIDVRPSGSATVTGGALASGAVGNIDICRVGN